MRSTLRSVSVATFTGVFWFLAQAAAQEAGTRVDGPRAAPPAEHKPEAPAEDDRLSDEAELARVVSLVEAAKYEECAARLSRLLDPKGPHPLRQTEIIETARLYQATCLIGLGKTEEADAPLRDAVRKNPQMRAPDSLTFPQKVIDRFIKVREELYDELRKAERETIERARREAAAKQKQENERWARMLTLERLARQETVVQTNRRWIALVPFGVGQFQNGNNTLGWVFFGSELALGATAVVSTAVYTHIQAKAVEYQNEGRPPGEDVSKRQASWHSTLVVSSYGLLGVAALGILEAQLSFVPEVKHIRERPLPKTERKGASLSVKPDVAFGPHDVTLGMHGSF